MRATHSLAPSCPLKAHRSGSIKEWVIACTPPEHSMRRLAPWPLRTCAHMPDTKRQRPDARACHVARVIDFGTVLTCYSPEKWHSCAECALTPDMRSPPPTRTCGVRRPCRPHTSAAPACARHFPARGRVTPKLSFSSGAPNEKRSGS